MDRRRSLDERGLTDRVASGGRDDPSVAGVNECRVRIQ